MMVPGVESAVVESNRIARRGILVVALVTAFALTGCLVVLESTDFDEGGRKQDDRSYSEGSNSVKVTIQATFGVCLKETVKEQTCIVNQQGVGNFSGPVFHTFEHGESASAKIQVDWEQSSALSQQMHIQILAVDSCDPSSFGWECDHSRLVHESTEEPPFEWTGESSESEPGEQYAMQALPANLKDGSLDVGVLVYETFLVSGFFEWKEVH